MAISQQDAENILRQLQELGIRLEAVSSQELVRVAQRHRCTAYDAAYLALAEREKVSFITGEWIGDYKASR